MNGITGVMARPSDAAGVQETKVGRLERQERAEEVEKRQSEIPPHGGTAAADMDEYIPGDEPVHTGLYWVSKDENGNPEIMFDDPSVQIDPKAAEEEPAPEKAEDGGEGEETCTVNTDGVDAEIRDLKKKQAELEQQLARAADAPEEQQNLRSQLQQVEREISMKDNDAYRRQHAQYIYG